MKHKFKTLDGWRGISILCVLAGHLLPLGPNAWKMNSAVASSGMVMFFILSGFLITHILLRDQNIVNFLIRRFMRIIPLAWLAIVITLTAFSADINTWVPHLFFYANSGEPMRLTDATSHFWSLCVEMQFYVLIAALVATLKSRAFMLLPVLCVAATAYRYINDVEISVITYYRIDEILAGCILALLYHKDSETIKRFFKAINPVYLFPLLLLCSHMEGGYFNYLRPYVAMLMIGSTLYHAETIWWNKILMNRVLVYIAAVSYALYIVHGVLSHTWLGDGDTLEKYLKRPLLFAATFGLAHLSTFYYEKYWINLGKRLTTRNRQPIVAKN